jgi:carbamoyltransferase
MFTLGLNAAFHDCAATLVQDGVVVAAAEEERFTHVKHGKRPVPFTTWQLPFHAIDFCLAQAGITLAQVDHFAYSYDPNLAGAKLDRRESISLPLEPSAQTSNAPWEPLFLSYIMNAPRQLAGGAPLHLQRRLQGVAHADIAAR